jgi:hypothetical protein
MKSKAPKDAEAFSSKADAMAELLSDYPELGEGLEEMVDQDSDGVVSLVGIFSLLQLRLRAVLGLIPHSAPRDPEQPGAGGE